MSAHDRVMTSPEEIDSQEERRIDRSLRPVTLPEFIGQARTCEQLEIFIEAARGRGEALDHVLIFGPPGLGKTTLAHILAHEMGCNYARHLDRCSRKLVILPPY